MKFTDTVDLVKRRTAGCLGPDGVDTAYFKFGETRDTGYLTFVLKDNPPADEVTKLAVRYQHLFNDHPDLSVKVLSATNYFMKDIETYSIWQCREGFCL